MNSENFSNAIQGQMSKAQNQAQKDYEDFLLKADQNELKEAYEEQEHNRNSTATETAGKLQAELAGIVAGFSPKQLKINTLTNTDTGNITYYTERR